MGKGFKPFKAPAKFAPPTKVKDGTEGSVSDDDSTKKDEHLEAYEVMYSKHINQKVKTWEEGLFVYNNTNFKAMLYNDL